MMNKKSLTTQQLADLTGLSIHTLRYYERIGLIDPVNRAENGHRLYGEQDLQRVQFLIRMRATGMSIREMQHYVELYSQGRSTLAQRRAILQAHRRKVQAQLATLQETLAFIDYKIDLYYRDEDCADRVAAPLEEEHGARSRRQQPLTEPKTQEEIIHE